MHPLNFGMFEGRLVGIIGQARSWVVWSFISLLRSRKLRLAMCSKRTRGGGGGGCAIVVMGDNY